MNETRKIFQVKKMKLAMFVMGAVMIANVSAMCASAAAEDITITVENLGPAGGLFFSPVWVGLHDGSFDLFDLGSPASSEVEALAEAGDSSGIRALFAGLGVDDVIAPGSPFGPAGSAFASTAQTTLTVNPGSDRYLSFASMVVPSNDAFYSNPDPMMYEVFDAAGNFNGPLTITIYGRDIWDAGTEVNNKYGGAAFVALGGVDVDENGVVHQHPGLDEFIGEHFGPAPVAGETLQSAFTDSTPIAQITVVPEPTSLLILGAGTLMLRYRKRT